MGGGASPPRTSALRPLLWLLGGLSCVLVLSMTGDRFAAGFAFGSGSLEFPMPRMTAFLAAWSFFGTLAALLMVTGVAGLAEQPHGIQASYDRAKRAVLSGGDGAWLAATITLTFTLALACRVFVLERAPITDDESAYRFAAQLLTEGRLTIPSPPDKLFFDRNFMANDGTFYSQYFLGWPALLTPFVALRLEDLANPVYAALTLPPIYWVVREEAGRVLARLALVLLATSPFFVLLAGTLMAHTSCGAALAWFAWLVVRARREGAGPIGDALVALTFSLAFFIRPLTAVGFGVVLLGFWAASVARAPRRLWRVASFLAVGAAFAALFLLVNHFQNGSPFRVAYQAVAEYYEKNGYRFTASVDTEHAFSTHPSLLHAVGTAGTALLRLNLDAFGWPSSLAVALLALGSRVALPWLLAFGFFLIAHAKVRFVGVDTIGPVHYAETVLLLVVLSAIGLRTGVDWARRSLVRPLPACVALGALVPVLVTLSVLVYLPRRLVVVHESARKVREILDLPQKSGLDRAVIFAKFPLVSDCRQPPFHSWVTFRPNNDPHLKSPVLWVNDVSPEENLAFLRKNFPDRTGHELIWTKSCAPALRPISSPR